MSPEISALLRAEALTRFLRYVTVHTTSDEESGRHPSSDCQVALARHLERELRELGAREVVLDEHCYVYATVPASPGARGPTVGLLAHLDTSPSVNGDGVKPIVRQHYDGGKLEFPDDPGLTLAPAECPELLHFVGDDIVTASGTTLLGADDKAGIAEIMAEIKTMLAQKV